MPTPTYQVRDGARLLTFEGELLGFISSEEAGKARWTEMSIYKTVGGSYILEKVGRSLMLHMPGCKDIRGTIPRFQTAHPGDDPDNGYEFHDCVPDEYDFPQLLIEEDRYWATIAEDPRRIIEALYRKKDGIRHMPRISIDLLDIVSAKDRSFTTWQVEHIA